jgi:hypothetical protein
MAKLPRDKEGAMLKKRTRKTTPQPENGAHADGNGAHADGNGALTPFVAVSPEASSNKQVSSNVEERIRLRAYQLYLERGGNGGSPEQDWFRALKEIRGRGSAA